MRWAPDGKSADVLDTRDGVSNIWRLELATGKRRPLTDYKSGQIFFYEWSRDGKWLAMARGKKEDDVVLITATDK
jgi:Tol biopolymer transport system component